MALTVLAKIGAAAYKLELPEEALVHSVFHVSHLKPQVPDYTPVFSSIPNPVDFSLRDVQPEAILDRRLVKKGNSALLQVLIKWSSLSADMATWEDYDVLRVRFPGASAWGQIDNRAGGSVSTEGTEGMAK